MPLPPPAVFKIAHLKNVIGGLRFERIVFSVDPPCSGEVCLHTLTFDQEGHAHAAHACRQLAIQLINALVYLLTYLFTYLHN